MWEPFAWELRHWISRPVGGTTRILGDFTSWCYRVLVRVSGIKVCAGWTSCVPWPSLWAKEERDCLGRARKDSIKCDTKYGRLVVCLVDAMLCMVNQCAKPISCCQISRGNSMICFKTSRDELILQSSQSSRLRLQSSHISCTCRNFARLKRRCAAMIADLISYVVCLGFQGYLKYQASVSRLGGKFSQPSHLGSA